MPDFPGSDEGGETAAVLMSFIAPCKPCRAGARSMAEYMRVGYQWRSGRIFGS
jgi:hypothetical protein